MDESDATDALEDLGLTAYEAQVFVALQKLETGSASDVDRIADIPRSQVYGAAEKLEERGLVEVQQSNPIRYRSVDLDEARQRLRNRFEAREDRAFEYLDDVRSNRQPADERQEDVWTLHGRDSVTARATQLIRDAEDEVLYGGGPDSFDDDLVQALTGRGDDGVDVTVLSADEDVVAAFEDDEAITAIRAPTALTPENRGPGRSLVVDGETILLSVLSEATDRGSDRETAIWSAETGFAAVIIQLLEAWLDDHMGD